MTSSLRSHAVLRILAALASTGAAVVHAAVVRDHWATWWVSGLFFVVLAVVQLAWAAAVLKFTTPAVLWAGVLINAGSATLWAFTRLAGQPVGPQAGTPLPVGPAGLLVLALELLVCGSVLLVLVGERHTQWRGVSAAVGLGAAAVVTGLTVPGVTAALEHDHAGHGDGHAHDSGAGHGSSGEPRAHQEENSPPTSEDGQAQPRGGHRTSARHDHSDSGRPATPQPRKGSGGDGHPYDGHSH